MKEEDVKLLNLHHRHAIRNLHDKLCIVEGDMISYAEDCWQMEEYAHHTFDILYASYATCISYCIMTNLAFKCFKMASSTHV